VELSTVGNLDTVEHVLVRVSNSNPVFAETEKLGNQGFFFKTETPVFGCL